MATVEDLMAIIGQAVDSAVVEALIVADRLTSYTEPDLNEGQPLRSVLSSKGAGYQLTHCLGVISTAFVFAEPQEGFSPFSGPFPGGLRRGATRAQVRAQFGAAERSGEATTVPILGRMGAWDRFAVGDLRVHFQYGTAREEVSLVTIMAASEAP